MDRPDETGARGVEEADGRLGRRGEGGVEAARSQGPRLRIGRGNPGQRTDRTDANIVTNASFGDVEAHLEFMLPKGSNSGIKFEGLYEVQIYDSYGNAKPKATDNGGIYPPSCCRPTTTSTTVIPPK